MSTLKQYKATAGRIANAIEESHKQGATPKQSTQGVAAWILLKKTTKGMRAALLCGLVVGALCERGLNDEASAILEYMSALIDEGKA